MYKRQPLTCRNEFDNFQVVWIKPTGYSYNNNDESNSTFPMVFPDFVQVEPSRGSVLDVGMRLLQAAHRKGDDTKRATSARNTIPNRIVAMMGHCDSDTLFLKRLWDDELASKTADPEVRPVDEDRSTTNLPLLCTSLDGRVPASIVDPWFDETVSGSIAPDPRNIAISLLKLLRPSSRQSLKKRDFDEKEPLTADSCLLYTSPSPRD